MNCIFKLEIAFWYLHPLASALKDTRDILRSGCSFLWLWSLLRAWSSSKILGEKWGVGRWGLNWPTQCTDAGKAARGQSQTPTQATHGFAPTLPSIASTLIPKYPTSRRVCTSSCCLYCPILQERAKNTSICIHAPGRLRHSWARVISLISNHIKTHYRHLSKCVEECQMGQTSRPAKHFLVMLPIMFRRQVFFLLYNSLPFSFVAIYSRDG